MVVFSDILIYAFRNPNARRDLQLNEIHFKFKDFFRFRFLPENSPCANDRGISFRIIRVDISRQIFFAIFLQYFFIYCPTGMQKSVQVAFHMRLLLAVKMPETLHEYL